MNVCFVTKEDLNNTAEISELDWNWNMCISAKNFTESDKDDKEPTKDYAEVIKDYTDLHKMC